MAGLAALSTSGCGVAGLGGGGGGGVTRFAWYGGAERQQAYTELIQIFESQNEGVTVEPEYADYEPYQDRLATQFAASDGPDLFFLAGFNVLEFAAAGIYRDVEEFVPDILDLSTLDQGQLESWRIDGGLTAIPYAFWNTAMRSNRDFLQEVGLELPDDSTWSWDDYAEVCQEFSDATEEGRWGTSYYPHADLPFNAWLRQHGQELFSADGGVGFDAEAMAGWMEYWERMRTSGAAMPVGAQEGVQPNWDVVAPHVLFQIGNANHLANEQPSVDWELDIHLAPVVRDPSPGHRFLHTVRFAMYENASDPEATARLMNFFLNSEEVPRLVGQNQGLPTALPLQSVARETADETGIKIIDLIEREAAMEMRARPEPPPGSGAWRDDMARTIEAIAVGGGDIDAESARFVDQLTESIERARD